jgi:hypothetical protein
MTTSLVSRAISSLWAVARRRYVGEPGLILPFDRDHVLVSLFGSQLASRHMAEGMTYPLPVEQRDTGDSWELQPVRFQVNLMHPGDDAAAAYARLNGQPQELDSVELPLRPSDVRQKSTSGVHLLPFSPTGSHVV